MILQSADELAQILDAFVSVEFRGLGDDGSQDRIESWLEVEEILAMAEEVREILLLHEIQATREAGEEQAE